MTERPALPDWPALMDVDLACAYLTVSEDTFRGLAARHRVQPIDMGFKVTRWRRRDLDRLVDSLPVRASDLPQPDRVDELQDPAVQALARVGQRTKGRR